MSNDIEKPDWPGVWRTSFEDAVYGAGLTPCGKQQAIRQIVRFVLEPHGYDNDAIETAITAVVDREAQRTCGIGGGLATPYARAASVKQIHAGWFHLREPLDWHAIDGKPVTLVYCQLSPTDEGWDGRRIHCLAHVERLRSLRESWRGLKPASVAEFRQFILELARPVFS